MVGGALPGRGAGGARPGSPPTNIQTGKKQHTKREDDLPQTGLGDVAARDDNRSDGHEGGGVGEQE